MTTPETDYTRTHAMTLLHQYIGDEAALIVIDNRYHPLVTPVPIHAPGADEAMVNIGNELVILGPNGEGDHDPVFQAPINRDDCLTLARAFLAAYDSHHWPEDQL